MMLKTRTTPHAGIVADGRERAYSASLREALLQVEREFAAALQAAGFWRRIVIRAHMRAEARRRARRFAPLDGLYFRCWSAVAGGE